MSASSLYTVSVRLFSKDGPTVWGDRVTAQDAAQARAEAERHFFTPLAIDPTWDESNRSAAERLEAGCAATRAKARAHGYVVIARKV